MAKHPKRPRELEEHLERLEGLRLELGHGKRGRRGVRYFASHVNGVLAMWLLVGVPRDCCSGVASWWTLCQGATAVIALWIVTLVLIRSSS